MTAARLPGRAKPTRPTGLIGLYPGFQSATDPSPQIDRLEDRSGIGNHMTLGANAVRATVWGTAGRITTPESTSGTQNHAFQLPWASVNWNKDTESLMIAGVINVANTANRWQFGFGGNSSVAIHGFMLRTNVTTGMPVLQLSEPGGLRSLNTGSVALADAADHHAIMFLDGPAKRAWVYVDGDINLALNGGTGAPGSDWSTYAAMMTAFGPLTVGGCPHTSANALSYTNLSYGWQFYKRTGSRPANFNETAKRLAKQPLVMLSPTLEWPA